VARAARYLPIGSATRMLPPSEPVASPSDGRIGTRGTPWRMTHRHGTRSSCHLDRLPLADCGRARLNLSTGPRVPATTARRTHRDAPRRHLPLPVNPEHGGCSVTAGSPRVQGWRADRAFTRKRESGISQRSRCPPSQGSRKGSAGACNGS